MTSTPLTYDEGRVLAAEVSDRDDQVPALLAALDTDEWFSACSIDELNPLNVEIVVRWAMREAVALSLMSVTGARSHGVLRDGKIVRRGVTERDVAERALLDLLDELRRINATATGDGR